MKIISLDPVIQECYEELLEEEKNLSGGEKE